MEQELINRLERIEEYVMLSAKNILTVKEVALLIGIAPKTVRNKINDIPHYNGPEGLRFKRDEVEAWMCQIRHEPITNL